MFPKSKNEFPRLNWILHKLRKFRPRWLPKKYKFIYCDLTRSWKHPFDPNDPNKSHGGFVLSYGVKDFGFGELTFRNKGGRYDEESDEIVDFITECDSDSMCDNNDKRFIEQAFKFFVKSVKIVS